MYLAKIKLKKKTKQTKYKAKEEKTEEIWKNNYLYCWMMRVGVAPSSSTCTREWGGSTNWQGIITMCDNKQQGSEATMGVGGAWGT